MGVIGIFFNINITEIFKCDDRFVFDFFKCQTWCLTQNFSYRICLSLHNSVRQQTQFFLKLLTFMPSQKSMQRHIQLFEMNFIKHNFIKIII